MSVEYYIVCHEREDMYYLGNLGSWEGLDLKTNRDDINKFADSVAKMHMGYWGENDLESYELYFHLGRKAWVWCEKRKWEVEFKTDADNDITAIRKYRAVKINGEQF